MIALVDSNNPLICHAFINMQIEYDNAGRSELVWQTGSWNDDISFEIISSNQSVAGPVIPIYLPPMPVKALYGTLTNTNTHYAQCYQMNAPGSPEVYCYTNNDINVGDKLYYYYFDQMTNQLKFENRTILAVLDEPYNNIPYISRIAQRLIVNGPINRSFLPGDLLDVRSL